MSDINFPGFAVLKRTETDRHHAIEGALLCDGITVRLEFLKDKQFQHLPPMIATVKTADQSRKLWTFQDEKNAGFTGVCVLVMTADMPPVTSTPVIAFVGRGREGKVERDNTLSSIAHELRSNSILENLNLKKAAAAALDREYTFTPEENRVIAVMTQRKREAEAAEAAEERKRREAQKAQRIALIMARPEISGFTKDGKRRRGRPVTGDEWMSLPNGTLVVMVDKDGNPVESFSVVRRPGENPKRGFAAAVTAEMPVIKTAPSLPQKASTATIEKGGDFLSVDIYRTKADVDALRKAGVNSGTLVGVPAGDKVTVYRLIKEKVETMGEFKPI
jgi:hypothetical protein